MTRTGRNLTVVAVLLGTFLAAIETTVVGTAMPTIIGKLGGVHLYGWVFSAYLLASTTTVPVYGRLADIFGRRPVYLFAATLFLVGSMLCGLAESMPALIAYRALQGLGAGGILPITLTIVGDLFPVEQRARMQGLFSAVWGVSSVAGPALGGFITDVLHWRWVFYVNVPVGLVSMGLLIVFFREQVERRRRRIDWVGALTLNAGLVALLLGLQAGPEGTLDAARSGPLAVLAAVLLFFFVRAQRRAESPMLPPRLFTNRVILTSNLIGFLSGAVLFGCATFVPPYVQGVLGGSATDAGLVLAPMSIAWTFASIAAGRILLRIGYRVMGVTGALSLVGGTALLLTLDPTSTRLTVQLAMLFVGLGMGLTATSFLIAVQNAVGWSERGVATASVQFFRTVGGSVALAVLGAVLNLGWTRSVGAGTAAEVLLDPTGRAGLEPGTLAALQAGFGQALHGVYAGVTLVAVLALLAALFFPSGTVEELAHRPEPRTT